MTVDFFYLIQLSVPELAIGLKFVTLNKNSCVFIDFWVFDVTHVDIQGGTETDTFLVVVDKSEKTIEICYLL